MAKLWNPMNELLKVVREGGDKVGENTAMEGIRRLSSGQRYNF